MTSIDMSKIAGYLSVADLLKDSNFATWKHVWSYELKKYVNVDGELSDVLKLELSNNRELSEDDTIVLIIDEPTFESQLFIQDFCQLDIVDYREDGWENCRFKIVDVEQDTDWEIPCKNIQLARGKKSILFKNETISSLLA